MKRLFTWKIWFAAALLGMVVASQTAFAAPPTGLNTGAGPWQWVRPPVQGATVNSVSFADANTGWGVGIGGTIIKTADGGASWSVQNSGTTYNLSGVKFVDANNGWAVGDAGTVLRTSNGGASWSAQSLPGPHASTATLQAVSFANTSAGVAVGGGYAFYTTNGGSTWKLATGVSTGHYLASVQMVNTTTGFAVGSGGSIYKTVNGGQTWSSVTSPTGSDLRSVWFAADGLHGYAVGSTGTGGRIIETDNGGTSWTSNTTNAVAKPLWGLNVAGGGNTFIAVGENGSIFRYSVSGLSGKTANQIAAGLSSVSSGTTSRLLSVAAPTSSVLYASGEGGAVTRSGNTGSTWNLKAGGNAVDITALSFINGDEGWMGGNNGMVLHTSDGGAGWSSDNSGIPGDADIHSIQFINNTTGFAVGCRGADCPGSGTGVAYKYSGGAWTAMSVPGGVTSLNSVHMTSATSGWAVGSGGVALRTSNGSTWSLANSGIPTSVELNSVDATNAASDGWAVGQASGGTGVLYKYSGGSWTAATLASPPSFLTSIDMVNASTGYAVGSGGKAYKTANGTSWSAMTTGTSKLLAAVSFVPGNANIGFATGEDGRIIHTRNGGETWSAENLGTNVSMYTLSTVSERQAYVGGGNGSVLKSLRPYYFTWYDNIGGSNWVLMANPSGAATDAWFDLFIGGVERTLGIPDGCPGCQPGQIPAGKALYARYTGLMGGPVNAASLTSDKAIVSQRILWPAGGSSLEEVLGTDIEKLSDHFYWTWYDQSSPGFSNWVLVANPNPFAVYYEIRVAGSLRSSGTIPAGQNVTPQFAGVIGGPVEVRAWTTSGKTAPANVMASQRVLMNNGAAFNEVPGIPAGELSSDYLWTWYDRASPGSRDWILVANPPGDAATSIYYTVKIGGQTQAGYACKGPIADNANQTPEFPGKINGPVEVQTWSNAACTVPANSIASQRITWNNGLSFEEVPGFPATSLSHTYHWTWYDQKSPGMTNWVLVANPGSATIYYEIKIGGTVVNSGDITPGEKRVTPTFPGRMGGPVQVEAWSNPGHTTHANVISSQRVLYNGYFNEVLGTVLD